jgi:hypothetical protein
VPNQADDALVEALAQYLKGARNPDEVRRAINLWRHDVTNQGLSPERILVTFKNILLGLSPPRGIADRDRWVVDQRDVILMCIEEYFSSAGAPFDRNTPRPRRITPRPEP